MDQQEGQIAYFSRISLTVIFWAAFAGGLYLFLKMIKEKGREQVKQDIRNLMRNLIKVIILFFEELGQILKKQYRISKIGFDSYQKSLQIFRAVFIIAFQQIVKGIISITTTLSEFINYLKDEGQANSNYQKKIMAVILDQLVCSISNTLIKQPMILTECGHTFDKQSLEALYAKKRQCPICKVLFNKINMKRNFNLEELLSKVSNESKIKFQQECYKKIQIQKREASIFLYLVIVLALVLYFIWPSSTLSPSEIFKQEILKKYNSYDQNLLSDEQFQQMKDKFIKLLDYKQSGSTFKIFRGNAQQQMEVDVKIIKEERFICELELTGRGQKYSWVATGYFMTKKEGLYFWMIITQVENDSLFKNTENDLILESYFMQIPIVQVTGKWYYIGKITAPLENGQWQIEVKPQSQKIEKKRESQVLERRYTSMINKLKLKFEQILQLH